MKIPSAEEVIKRSKIHPSKVKCIYVFGSRVYGTSGYSSDWDFIMIANNAVSNQEIRSGDFNIHVIVPDEFEKMLKAHHPGAIECFYAPQEFRLLETIKFDFKISIPSLRHSFSHVSSNSWVKCKKKLEQNDYYIGVKSLFHSLRIPMFGIQIAKDGYISDFSCANKIYDIIFSRNDWTWDELDEKFRPLKNQILTDFRKVTQK
jgi:predicted nucleotidyltransferase